VTLIAVVARAAAVALMMATLLLPIADHHAIGRLPEVALQVGHAEADLHALFVHHHPHPRHAAAPAASRDFAAPTFAPALPLPSGVGAVAPQAAPAPTLFLPPLPGQPAASTSGPPPTSLLEPPPDRPPNRAA